MGFPRLIGSFFFPPRYLGWGRERNEGESPPLPLLFPLLFPHSSFRPRAGQPVREELSFRMDEDAGGEFVRSMEKEEEEEASDYH